MTPLARILARLMPRPLLVPALALAYGVMIISLLVARQIDRADIVYIDAGSSGQ
jgi:hypothetical protein